MLWNDWAQGRRLQEEGRDEEGFVRQKERKQRQSIKSKQNQTSQEGSVGRRGRR